LIGHAARFNVTATPSRPSSDQAEATRPFETLLFFDGGDAEFPLLGERVRVRGNET